MATCGSRESPGGSRSRFPRLSARDRDDGIPGRLLGARGSEVTPVVQVARVGPTQSPRTERRVLLALELFRLLLPVHDRLFVADPPSLVVGLRWRIVGVAACYLVATISLIEPFAHPLTTRALSASPSGGPSARSPGRAGHGGDGCDRAARDAIAAGGPGVPRLALDWCSRSSRRRLYVGAAHLAGPGRRDGVARCSGDAERAPAWHRAVPSRSKRPSSRSARSVPGNAVPTGVSGRSARPTMT